MTAPYLGVNYWDSQNGTDMWARFDENVIAADLDALAKMGVNTLRVFPNWRDFQPVTALYGWRGAFSEFRVVGDGFPEDPCSLDPIMIQRFLTLCDLAQERGMRLIVAVVTGWMSGRLFVPPALEGKNIITDPMALMWQVRFCRGFVSAVKHHRAIAAWELGNECNCLGQCLTPYDAYLWTYTIRSAISLADPSREVYSGMHGLDSEEGGIWTIQDQGELTDLLTCHPYPSPTVGGDVTPANQLRCTMIPTAQLAYYRGISGKDVMIEEQGTFSEMLINRAGGADFMRVNLLSCYANESRGYLWWCGMEHLRLNQPPYSWSMIERELGLLDVNRNPKPVAVCMKETGARIASLPPLPPKQIDALCLLPRAVKHWPIMASSYILGKLSGIEMTTRTSMQIRKPSDLPSYSLYFVPCLTGWASLCKESYQALLSRAEEGASVCFSVADGFITEFESVSGMRSMGMMQAGADTMTLESGEVLPICYRKKFLLESIGAKVLARDSGGNPVLTRKAYGKGFVYMLFFPLEQMLWDRPWLYSGEDQPDYGVIYRLIARDLPDGHPITCGSNRIGMTLHPDGEGYYAALINYDDKPHETALCVKPGWRVETVSGDAETVPGCDMTLLRLTREP